MMKKEFMLFLMAVMMSFSAMCYASHGSDLDAEDKIVTQFFATRDYKKASSFMDPALSKNLTADKYKDFFAAMDKDLGKITEKVLRAYEVFDDGHVLTYAAKFEKGQVLLLKILFKSERGKYSIMDFFPVNPNANRPAPADNKEEKK